MIIDNSFWQLGTTQLQVVANNLQQVVDNSYIDQVVHFARVYKMCFLNLRCPIIK